MEHSLGGETDTSAICVSVCVPVAGIRGATDRGGWGRGRGGKKKENGLPHAAASAGVAGAAMCTFAESKQRERLGM